MSDSPPDWAFSADQNLRCPECDELLAGLDWILSDPHPAELMSDATETGQVVTGMKLIPCDHVLDTASWELKFSGRDRKFGTVIRTPKFVQKG